MTDRENFEKKTLTLGITFDTLFSQSLAGELPTK